MAWCCQATSQYLKQFWWSSVMPYDVTGPQWVNLSCLSFYYYVLKCFETLMWLALTEKRCLGKQIFHDLLNCDCLKPNISRENGATWRARLQIFACPPELECLMNLADDLTLTTVQELGEILRNEEHIFLTPKQLEMHGCMFSIPMNSLTALNHLNESLLTYHQWSLVAFTWDQFLGKCSRYVSLIWVWNFLI